MAKTEYTEMQPEDLTKEQIIQLAQWANILNEENKNLKGYITQLKAQLQNARQGRALAQHQLHNATTHFEIKTSYDNE